MEVLKSTAQEMTVTIFASKNSKHKIALMQLYKMYFWRLRQDSFSPLTYQLNLNVLFFCFFMQLTQRHSRCVITATLERCEPSKFNKAKLTMKHLFLISGCLAVPPDCYSEIIQMCQHKLSIPPQLSAASWTQWRCSFTVNQPINAQLIHHKSSSPIGAQPTELFMSTQKTAFSHDRHSRGFDGAGKKCKQAISGKNKIIYPKFETSENKFKQLIDALHVTQQTM